MSISQNFPDLTPSLNLNFAGSKKLDSRVTFTRGSTGTYMDDNGIIKTAGINQPRFDHSFNGTSVESLGLLVEESRSNIALQSQSFNTSPNTTFQLTVSADATTAPDGTTTADKLVENTANSSRNVYQSVGTISGNYTVSCFLKAAGRHRGYLQLYNNSGGNAVAFFDLNLGTITTSTGTTTITPYSNGWYRVTASANFPSDVTTMYLQLQDNSGNSTYTGDGSSGLFVWGLQVEAGAFPTSYIPTGASQVTRSADNATITGTNFSSWYNQTEGTLMYQGFARRSSQGSSGIGLMSDSTLANRPFQTQIEGSPPYIVSYQISSGAVVAFGALFVSDGDPFKVISAGKTNDFAFCFNGGTVTTDTSGTYPANVETFFIGRYLNAGYYMCGCMKSITYYPKRLTNTQLQNLTK